MILDGATAGVFWDRLLHTGHGNAATEGGPVDVGYPTSLHLLNQVTVAAMTTNLSQKEALQEIQTQD